MFFVTCSQFSCLLSGKVKMTIYRTVILSFLYTHLNSDSFREQDVEEDIGTEERRSG